jgi:hypothetical protein
MQDDWRSLLKRRDALLFPGSSDGVDNGLIFLELEADVYNEPVVVSKNFFFSGRDLLGDCEYMVVVARVKVLQDNAV